MAKRAKAVQLKKTHANNENIFNTCNATYAHNTMLQWFVTDKVGSSVVLENELKCTFISVYFRIVTARLRYY